MFLGKCLKWNLNFQNWSKSLCLGVSEPAKRLAAQRTAYALRNWPGKQEKKRKNEKKEKKMKKKKKKSEKKKSKSAKSLRYMGEFFSPTNDFSILDSCQLYIIVKFEASNCCKIEAVIQRCSVKKVFFKILQNSQENPCISASFLIKLQPKKGLWHMCFSVNIAKFLRTPFFIEHLRWLSLVKLEPSL